MGKRKELGSFSCFEKEFLIIATKDMIRFYFVLLDSMNGGKQNRFIWDRKERIIYIHNGVPSYQEPNTYY